MGEVSMGETDMLGSYMDGGNAGEGREWRAHV